MTVHMTVGPRVWGRPGGWLPGMARLLRGRAGVGGGRRCESGGLGGFSGRPGGLFRVL